MVPVALAMTPVFIVLAMQPMLGGAPGPLRQTEYEVPGAKPTPVTVTATAVPCGVVLGLRVMDGGGMVKVCDTIEGLVIGVGETTT